ncbi:hypothetical protein DL546_008577 [Coniochaeta pulveracea]|uniref:MPN domain-containing protein n=1 Tax=Coniochaeta pulveracea TaxID=177199 RepID=A0A420YFH6_9PEZI|nr:hypothetical protein DL546_008577 [Coniochaeta pulveracea]
MAVDTEQFAHISRPLAPNVLAFGASNAPLTVNVQPTAIFSILDHAVRREQPTRVIGALVGVRSEDGTEVEVRSTFAIPHTENEDQVEVDVEYQQKMLALTLRATSSSSTASHREQLLGWYTTSHELNSFSALIQNFFASPETGTFPHPAVHLTINTEPGAPVTTKTYISSPVAGAPESCLFVSVPHRLLRNQDTAALEAIAHAGSTEENAAPLVTDIDALARALENVTGLLDRVSNYTSEVLDEERDGNTALGQHLMNALSLAPKVDPEAVEADFNNHIQDVLMVSYLANTIRTQIDLAQRLATSNIIGFGDKDGEKKDGEDGEKRGGDRRDGGGRGGKRGGRGGGRGGNQNREPREPREPTE